MKPFDLEAAKRGEPIFNSLGEKQYFLGVKRNGDIVIEQESGRVSTYASCYVFMAPKKRTVWANLYTDGFGTHWRTEEAANIAAGKNRIGGKAWPVEIEEI